MVVVLINPHGGTAKQPDALAHLRQALASQLPDATVAEVAAGSDLAARAQAAVAAGATIVAAAGGDGTISSVAQCLVGSTTRLGVLPFGTRNHFARDLGVPLDLAEAVALLRAAPTRQIDVGQINQRYFINNASIGLYPALVAMRDAGTKRLPKQLRTLLAALQLSRSAQPVALSFSAEGHQQREPVWLFFAGNNSYNLSIIEPARRPSLSAGLLDIVAVPAEKRRRVLGLAFNELDTLLTHSTHFTTRQIVVQIDGAATCAVALDGETMDMTPPLLLKSVAGGLSVIAPA